MKFKNLYDRECIFVFNFTINVSRKIDKLESLPKIMSLSQSPQSQYNTSWNDSLTRTFYSIYSRIMYHRETILRDFTRIARTSDYNCINPLIWCTYKKFALYFISCTSTCFRPFISSDIYIAYYKLILNNKMKLF